MALKKTNVSFPFTGGLDEKTSEKIAPPGTLQTAENCQFTKQGEIVKRKGFETMWAQTSTWAGMTPTDSTLIGGGVKVQAHGEELLIADGKRLFSVSDGYAKDKGEYLNCTFENGDLIQDEEEKIGPVQHVRFETDSSDEYDLLVYTAALPAPVTSLQSNSIHIRYAIRSVSTGDFIIPPTLVATVSRSVSTVLAKAANPQPQLLYNAALKTAYIIFGSKGSGGTTVKYNYRTIRLDSISQFALSATTTEITTLATGSGTPCPAPVNSFICVVADQETPVTTTSKVFIAFYGQNNSKGASYPGDLILLQLVYAGDVSNPSLTLKLIENVTGGTYASSTHASQDDDFYNKFGISINLSLKYIEGLDGATSPRPVNLFYSVRSPTTGTDYETKVSAYDVDLVSQTDTTFPGNSILLGASVVTSKTNNNKGIFAVNTIRDRDHGGSFYKVAGGAVSLAGGGVGAAGTGFSEGLYKMPGGIGTGANFYGTNSATVYIPVSGGVPQVANITVVDGGNNLNSSTPYTITSPSTASGGVDAVLQFASSTTSPDNPRQPEPSIFVVEKLHLAGGGVSASDGHYINNVYLLSDLFHHDFSNSRINAVDKKPYCLVSASSGVGQTSSGTCALIRLQNLDAADESTFPDDLLAYGLPGEMSLNQGTEIGSLQKNDLSLTQSPQRVQTKGTNILIGANKFVKKVDTSTKSSTTFASSSGQHIFNDSLYNGSLITIDTDPARPCPMLSLKDKLLLGGGGTFSYDSQELIESDFIHGPEQVHAKLIDLRNGVYASNSMTPGDYSYAAVFSYIDNKGNLHESNPVFTDTLTIPSLSASGVYLELFPCSITKKPVYKVDIYRTDGDGQIYYKISSFVDDRNFGNFGINNLQTFTFIDRYGQDDFDIENREVLYITGGVATNSNPGSVTDLTLHKDKVVATLPGGFNVVSKPVLVGESVSFPLVGPFVLNLGNVVKSITATGSARDMLIVFTEDDVYAYMGDGPNATGAIGFTQPKLLSSGQGAIPGSFVVSSSAGMYYLSNRGLYSILSNGQIQYVSPQVESKLAPKAVVGMDIFDELNELRLSLSTGDILVYNYLFKRWSEWDTNIQIASQTRYQPTIGGSSVTSHVLLNTAGSPVKQSVNSFTDSNVTATVIGSLLTGVSVNTSSYDFKIKTTPISANQLFGAQRVYRVMLLGDYISSHRASYNVFHDYKATPSTQGTLSVSADTDPYLYRIHLTQQKNRAVQLEFVADQSTGGCLVLNGIAFEIGQRPDTFKLPKAQTIQGS